jgi:type II secretory pathway pseudopilin PulG
MVELLVTIILSGIFFAAMVPLFVLAAQQGSTDRARVMAANQAQSTIEDLRSLSYDDLFAIKSSDPANPFVAYAPGQGWKGGQGGVNVSVVPYPLDSQKGQERYLLVTAQAWWTAPDVGLRDVTLRTAVYRQGLGTHTLLLYAYPLQSGMIKEVPVNVVARLDAGDAMTTRRVDFEVWANNGTAIANWSVYTDESDSPSARLGSDGYYYYEQPWAAEGVADGTYTFIAKTVPVEPSEEGDPEYGVDWARKQYVLDLVPPGQPEGLSCTPGFQPVTLGGELRPSVTLDWEHEANISDVGHLEVERNGIDAAGVPIPLRTFTISVKSARTFVDRDVQIGATYTYRVLVEDAQGGRGDWSEPQPCTIPAAGDVAVPSPPPAPLTATVPARSVKLDWVASADKDTVDFYRVYRDAGLAMPFPQVAAARSTTQSAYTYTDITAEYGGIYTYYVTAVRLEDGVLWESVSLSGSEVRIPQPPVLSMRISLAVGNLAPSDARPKTARVAIHSLDTGAFIPANPWEYPTLNFTGNSVWDTTKPPAKVDLYQGSYEVIAMFYSQTGQRLGAYTEYVNLTSLATPVTVTYRGPN